MKFHDLAPFKKIAEHFDVPQAGDAERSVARELLQFIDLYIGNMPAYQEMWCDHLRNGFSWDEHVAQERDLFDISVGRFEWGWCTPDCPEAVCLFMGALRFAPGGESAAEFPSLLKDAFKCHSKAQHKHAVAARHPRK